jgi:hypothetical protein
MADSRVRIAVYAKDDNYQVRVTGASGRTLKKLCADLNFELAEDALPRMDEYADLRGDDAFESPEGEICLTCRVGRLALIRDAADEEGHEIAEGESLVPSSDRAEQILTRDDKFADELGHILEENLPFYKKGPATLIKGLALRVGILIVLALVGRGVYLTRTDHFQPRSLQAIMKTLEEPYVAQNAVEFFVNPNYTHRSKLRIQRPLYIRGNNVILEGGFYVKLDGIQNLKASIEAHNNEPVTLKVDTREGEMRLTGVYVGEDLITPKGKIIYQGRIPVSGQPPARVDALDTNARGAYVRVRDADPQEEATFNWMLGQTVSVTASLSNDGDRYLIGEDEFKFAIPKDAVREEIREILDMAAAAGERAIVDMRLSSRAYPERNRRNPREQRRDTNIVAEGNMHYVTVQSAVLKNI